MPLPKSLYHICISLGEHMSKLIDWSNSCLAWKIFLMFYHSFILVCIRWLLSIQHAYMYICLHIARSPYIVCRSLLHDAVKYPYILAFITEWYYISKFSLKIRIFYNYVKYTFLPGLWRFALLHCFASWWCSTNFMLIILLTEEVASWKVYKNNLAVKQHKICTLHKIYM